MSTPRLARINLLLCALSVFVYTACSPAPTLPNVQSASVSQISSESDDNDLATARPRATTEAYRIETTGEVLRRFFKLLHAGEYGRAAAYYGGDYEVMRDHNPGIPPDDYAALFDNACTINGAQCLEIRQVTLLDQPSNVEWRFAVQFTNEDGSLFSLGPYGEDDPEGEPQDEFIYTVKIECTGKYLVREPPVYLP